jgi:hypothetical protein
MMLFLFFPVLLLIRCYFEGIFMRKKQSSVIGASGAMRMILLMASGWLILQTAPQINGVFLGMVLMMIATISDAVFMALSYVFRKDAYPG